MSLWSWPLTRGRIVESAFDPFDFMWPDVPATYDDFFQLRTRLMDDMARREEIFENMHQNFFKDFMLFMNNPETSRLDPSVIRHAVSSSTEHTQDGKNHTFKRSVTVNGKTDTVSAIFDGEKTIVNYDGDKQVVVPGFYDITLNVIKDGTPESAPADAKLREMNQMISGKDVVKAVENKPSKQPEAQQQQAQQAEVKQN